MIKKASFALAFILSVFLSKAQITTSVNPTVAQLQQKLSGNGVTISSVSLTCPNGAYALYSGGTGQLATLPTGILLTTGSASNVAGPNNVSFGTDNLAAGSALGNTIEGSGNPTFDACYLTFLITPACHTLSINYVFASNEYSDYVGALSNDVFGFVLDGPNPSGGNYTQSNIALVPGTTLPVSINNVNNGTGTSFLNIPPTGPCMNCAYFQDQPAGMVYNGSTTVLTASTAVTPCQQYTMTIGVWDVNDGVYDSAVFLDVNGLSCANSPTIVASSSPSVVCGTAATITLTATGGIASSTYTWSAPASGGLAATTGSVVTANPTSTTIYTLSYSDVNSCPGLPTIKTTTFTFISSAPITVTPSNTTICSGQSKTIIASGTGPFVWTASSGTNPPNTGTVTVTPTITTTYTVISGSGTCTTSAVSTVSVVPAFSLTATPSTTTICRGNSANLSISGATNYTWSPAATINLPNSSLVIANPSVTTTYTITGANGICTQTTISTVSVTIVSTSVTANSTFYCTGVTPVTLAGTGATTYSWGPSTGLSPTGGAVVSATPSVTTVYSVTGTTGLCSSTKTILVNVPATASLTAIASNTLICSGFTTTLSVVGANTYTWLPVSSNASLTVVSPTLTTTYSVAGQTSVGCIAVPAIITISIAPTPIATITASSPTVCITKTVSISTIPTGGSYSYTWTPTSGIQGASNASSIIAQPTSTGTTIYTLTISNGLCTSASTVSIDIYNCFPPTVHFTTLTNDSICSGGCVTFSANVIGDQPMTYQWLFPGGTPSSDNQVNPESCYLTSGSFTVGLIATNLYGADTLIKYNYISVVDTPNVRAFGDTLIKVGYTAPIFATGASTYYWTPNNGTIACPTCSNTTAQPTVTTQYIVIGSNSPYCKSQDTITVNVDFICGDFFVPNVFSPNGDGLNDVVHVQGFCISTVNFQIYDRWGERVFESNTKTYGWDGTYKGKPMDTGVFMYKADGITIDNKPYSIKGNITLLR